jgi:hypothetical protein
MRKRVVPVDKLWEERSYPRALGRGVHGNLVAVPTEICGVGNGHLVAQTYIKNTYTYLPVVESAGLWTGRERGHSGGSRETWAAFGQKTGREKDNEGGRYLGSRNIGTLLYDHLRAK